MTKLLHRLLLLALLGCLASGCHRAAPAPPSPSPEHKVGYYPGLGQAGQVPTMGVDGGASGWATQARVSSNTAYGTTGNGTTDDAPALLNGMTAVVDAGTTLWTPTGTYELATKFSTPSNTSVELCSGCTFNQRYDAGTGQPWSNTLFYAQAVQRLVASGTLSSTPALYSSSVSVTMASTPLVGDWMELVAANVYGDAGTSTGGDSIYKILTVSGSSSPYTLTFERPIVFAFQSGDVAIENTSVPEHMRIDGHGATAEGTGDGHWELPRSHDVHLRDLHGSVATGTTVQGGAFDTAAHDNVAEECSEDMTGAEANIAVGFYTQSGERTVFRDMTVKGPPEYGFEMYDGYQIIYDNTWTYGGNGGGTYLGTLEPGFPGNIDCEIRGGGALAVSQNGLAVYNSQDTKISTYSIRGAGGIGVLIGNGAVKTQIGNISAVSCAGGMSVQNGAIDTHITSADVSYATGGSGGSTYAAFDAYVGVEVDSLFADLLSGQALYALRAQGTTTQRFRNVRFTTDVTTAQTVVTTASDLWIDGAVVSNEAGGYGFYGQGGTAHLNGYEALQPSGSGFGFFITGGTYYLTNSSSNATYGLYVSGGTVNIGPGCAFDTASNPVTNAGGTLTMQQTGGTALIAGSAGTKTLTFAQMYNTAIEVSGISSGTDTVVPLINIPGMQWSFRNNNTSTSTTTFAGITVAVGKSAIIRINSAGSGERVTPDT